MTRSCLFFKLFPPPKFLTMPHAGVEISDDAIRMIQYSSGHKRKIIKYDKEYLPEGLVDNGDIHDQDKFVGILSSFVKRNKLSYAKVSLPEEKVYLFQTDVPSDDVHEVTQNIEFKLEENVPLSVDDSVFYFDMLPAVVTGGPSRASVSVVAKGYLEKLIIMLKSTGLEPFALEVVPKSVVNAVIPFTEQTVLVVHIMRRKAGIYVVSSGVVCFSSTIGWSMNSGIDSLSKEVHRVHDYWTTRPDMHFDISNITFVGEGADVVLQLAKENIFEDVSKLVLANTWANILDLEKYLPPISSSESLEYAVAAGLALPL